MHNQFVLSFINILLLSIYSMAFIAAILLRVFLNYFMIKCKLGNSLL